MDNLAQLILKISGFRSFTDAIQLYIPHKYFQAPFSYCILQIWFRFQFIICYLYL